MDRSAPLAALFATLALAPAPMTGAPGPASLVRDIALGEEPVLSAFFDVGQLVPVGNRVLFSAGQPDSGRELWGADGMPGGTRLLLDLCPGPCLSRPDIVTTLGNVAFWTGYPMGDGETEIWRTDGTRGGTFRLESEGVPLLVDRYDDFEDPRIDWVELGGLFYFEACAQGQDVAGCGTWRSDGTPAGTRRVEGLSLGSHAVLGDYLYFADDRLWRFDWRKQQIAQVAPVSGYPLIAAGDKLFFLSYASGDGQELWVSDGTEAGTRKLTDFPPLTPFDDRSLPQVIRAFGDRIYFLANDGVHGQEIWVSDGSPGGTRQVSDFAYATAFRDSWFQPWQTLWLEEIGGHLIFEATDGLSPRRLWIDNGRGSQVPLESFCPGGCFSEAFPPLLRLGNHLLFAAKDAAHGLELWSTDGTPKGTRIVSDVCAGPCSSELADLRSALGEVVFWARDDRGQAGLWHTDGTAQGTRVLTRPPDGEPSHRGNEIAMAGGRLFVLGYGYPAGVWVIDGPDVRKVTSFSEVTAASANPTGLTPVGNLLFFSAEHETVERLWRTAGTPESTFPLEPGNGFPGGLTAVGSHLYFVLEGSPPRRLWRSDGTPSGTRPIELPAGVEPGYIPFAAFDGHLFFAVVLAGGGMEVWKTDGTPQGTRQAFRLPGETFVINHLTSLGNELYFTAQGESSGTWRSDGTIAGTRRVTPAPATSRFVRAGGRVFFFSDPWEMTLWSTDGTAAGTQSVSGFGTIDPADMVEHQGALLFFASPGRERPGGLWRSDGTEEGTLLIRQLARSLDRAYEHPLPSPIGMVSAGGRVFFFADDGAHGTELWASDGTPEGTTLVRDLHAGPRSAAPSGLTAAGGLAFFSAHDGVHGFELWSSDGTAAGTRLVQDLFPGASSSLPGQLTAFDGHLFFTADDGLTGRELWKLPLQGPGCQPSSTRLCLSGGRFQIEVAWRDFQGRIGRGTASPLTGDTGYFWFFDPANAEVVLKVLDGRGLNDHHWVFYGALSSVEYAVTVTDTQTGQARRYLNPSGQLASVGDTHGFGPLGAHSAAPEAFVAAPSPPALVSGRTEPAAATGTCTPDPQRLCLNDGRFAVEASWKDFQGHTGRGTAVPLTSDTGWFWFFDSSNVEVMLKVLDGTPLNGKFWVFYGALSNVEYTLTVTDTQTGAVKEYRNPSGRFASVADTRAF